ncbi:MAG TPA: oxidoreductase [Chitinophagaceae bacterium]
MKLNLVVACCILVLSAESQLPFVIVLQDSIQSSLRGLSVPSERVIWTSGSRGTVGKSIDGGAHWNWMKIAGYEQRDFRDIEAFDSLNAVVMAVDNPALILRTSDGGNHWKVVFRKEAEGMFLDAMHFNGRLGICIGDPLPDPATKQKRFFILRSDDRGETWAEDSTFIPAGENEALFAASGSNIGTTSPRQPAFMFVTGGSQSFLYTVDPRKRSWRRSQIPVEYGKPAAGAFSMAVVSPACFFIAGGNYQDYWKDTLNIAYTFNGGKSWKQSAAHGYRSCIIGLDKKRLVTCGTNGVDFSNDGGRSWKLIFGDGNRGTEGFNVCAKSKTGKAVYFAGNGTVAMLQGDPQ